MAKEGKRYTVFTRRAMIIGALQLFGFSALGARLYYLSVLKGESYRLRADKNRISLRVVVPERGDIYDRRGTLVATNRKDYRVFMVPEEADDVAGVLQKISSIIPLSDASRRRLLRRIDRQPKFWSVTVAQQLSWHEFSRINVALPDLPGIQPDAGRSRFYPYGGVSAHIVGYLGDPPKEGKEARALFKVPGFKVGREGLENRFDEYLRGQEGSRRVEVNSVGREIRELPPRKDAQAGAPLGLTLDLRLQSFAHDLVKEESAGIVVMHAKTGDLHAAVSTPGFDPNEFTNGISQENWQALLDDPRKPLLNKFLAGQVPPGSTIKGLMALAGLKAGHITEQTKVFCNGKHRLGNNTFHCWKPGGHGFVTLQDAIAKSCDVYFFNLAEQLDVDEVAKFASEFGLGMHHDIQLDGQKKGLVPTRQWKIDRLRDDWRTGDMLNVSIGQGAMLTTPLQLAVMTARLATGRKIRPRLVLGDEPGSLNAENLTVNPAHLRLVRSGLEAVTAFGGSGYDPRRSRSAPKQAGKTGTAQVRRITMQERDAGVIKNKDLPWNSRDHALYIGYAPAHDPEFVVSVLVEHGGGGSKTAAPIGQKILDEALRLSVLDRDGAQESEADKASGGAA